MSNKKKRGVKRGSDEHRAYIERRERNRKLVRYGPLVYTDGITINLLKEILDAAIAEKEKADGEKD